MAVDEQRLRIRRSIEEKLGVEEAAYIIEGRPAGGWDALVTKEYLDLRLEALASNLRAEMAALRSDVMETFHKEITRQLRWLVPTILGSITAGGTALGIAAAIAG